MLDLSGINYWAVLVAWVINMAVGAFWYSPLGFGKLWTKLSGVDILKLPQDEANRALGFVALFALVQSVALAIVVNSLHTTTFMDGLWLGLLLWFGLTAATTIGATFYSRRGWKFWWLNASFFLIVLVLGTILLAVWQ